MYKGYKVRIYPTKEQEQLLWKHIGACRFIWNYMLDLQNKRYEQGEKHLSAFDMINLLKPLKNDGEHEWLYEVSNKSLIGTCQDLDKSFRDFFNHRSRHPKIKSKKKSKPSYPARSDFFYIKSDKFMKIEKLGDISYKTDRKLPIGIRACKFTDVRVCFENNKWFVCFCRECESQAPVLTDSSMGIDLGVKELAVVAVDEKEYIFPNINKSRKVRMLEKKLRHTQRTISRKYEANKNGNAYVKTNNIIRAEDKMRKLYHHLTGIRQNYLHQTTHALVSMLPKRIVMEDLNVSGLMKNKRLSKAIAEQGFAEFIRQIKYKSENLGIEFVQADKFYPSSKTCSSCGNIKKDLKLRDRTYVCPVCGLKIDRDFNAALNLSRYVVDT